MLTDPSQSWMWALLSGWSHRWLEKTLRDWCSYFKEYKWKLSRNAFPATLLLLTQWGVLLEGKLPNFEAVTLSLSKAKACRFTSGVVPKEPYIGLLVRRQKGAANGLPVWAAPLYRAAGEAEFYWRYLISLLHAWPPLAPGRSIVPLRLFSFHFRFRAAPIRRVHKFTNTVTVYFNNTP